METVLLIIGGAFVLFIAYTFIKLRKYKNAEPEADSDNVKVLNDKNFNSQIKSGITMVDFWAAWCVPCKMMIPTVNQLADEFEGKAKIAKLNIDESKQIAAKYQIRSIPTSIIFENGKEVKRISGVKPFAHFEKEINNIL